MTSRRSVLKAATYGLPVVAVAVATPYTVVFTLGGQVIVKQIEVRQF